MKGLLYSHLLLPFLMVSYCRPTKIKRCSSNDQCKFGAKCVNRLCLCSDTCSDLGHSLICGEDGNYHLNRCFLAMKSCEEQRNIRMHSIGASRHCRRHELHSYARHFKSHSPCRRNRDYCQNYGICGEKNGTPFCLCPLQFSGARCESRKETDLPKFTKKENSAFVSASKNYERQHIPVLVLCFFSATFSSILTSAICYRYNLAKIRKISKKFRPEDEFNPLKNLIFDSHVSSKTKRPNRATG